MKINVKNDLHLIIIGLVGLAISFLDVLVITPGTTWDKWRIGIVGWIGLVLFAAPFVWLFFRNWVLGAIAAWKKDRKRK